MGVRKCWEWLEIAISWAHAGGWDKGMWIWLDSNERGLNFLIYYVLEVLYWLYQLKMEGILLYKNTHLGNFGWVFMMFLTKENLCCS